MRTGIGLLTLLGLLLLLPSLCSAATVYVDYNADPNGDGTSWEDAYDTIAEALTDAGYGDEIWVAAGTYYENLTMGAGDEMYGGFEGDETTFGERDYEANETTIDGDASGSCVVMNDDTIIDGFTITNGYAAYGGGILGGGSSLTITNNTITGNEAAGFGGGIRYGGSSATIMGNTITGNTAAGAGGGIDCSGNSATITNNTIADNLASWGGGIDFDGSSATVTNNTIIGNSASFGGGICCTSSPAISNNIIVSNTATYGGGIYCDQDPEPTLTHNDVWNNDSDDYYGCDEGDGDISADPLFADAANGDYHLTSSSPCIDAGDENYTPDADFEGDARPIDGDGDEDPVVDIGADEYGKWTTSPEDWFEAGWIWFSIPLEPIGSADASDVLGFNCNNILYAWADPGKTYILYPGSFTDLFVGRSYMFYLSSPKADIAYAGSEPGVPFTTPSFYPGTSWVGGAGLTPISGDDIEVTRDGQTRTGEDDYNAAEPWIDWEWSYYDPYTNTTKTMCPYGGDPDDDMIRPWYGYRMWVNVVDGNVPVTLTFWPD